MTLLDVREKEEFRAGFIPGAISIPRGFLEKQVEQKLPDKNAADRRSTAPAAPASALAAKTLAELGYTNVETANPGFVRWKDLGYPMELPPHLTDAQRDRYSRHILLPEVGEARAGEAPQGARCSCSARAASAAPRRSTSPRPASARSASSTPTRSTPRTCSARSCTPRAASACPKVESAEKAIDGSQPRREGRQVTRSGSTARTSTASSPDYDVIVDGCDNFPTRYLVNDASVFLKKPGRARLDLPLRRSGDDVRARGDGPCYRCLYPEPPPPHLAPCARRPACSASCRGIVGIAAGDRGDQAHPRHAATRSSAASHVRLAQDEVPRAQAAPRQELPGVRRVARPSRATSTTKASARRKTRVGLRPGANAVAHRGLDRRIASSAGIGLVRAVGNRLALLRAEAEVARLSVGLGERAEAVRAAARERARRVVALVDAPEHARLGAVLRLGERDAAASAGIGRSGALGAERGACRRRIDAHAVRRVAFARPAIAVLRAGGRAERGRKARIVSRTLVASDVGATMALGGSRHRIARARAAPRAGLQAPGVGRRCERHVDADTAERRTRRLRHAREAAVAVGRSALEPRRIGRSHALQAAAAIGRRCTHFAEIGGPAAVGRWRAPPVASRARSSSRRRAAAPLRGARCSSRALRRGGRRRRRGGRGRASSLAARGRARGGGLGRRRARRAAVRSHAERRAAHEPRVASAAVRARARFFADVARVVVRRGTCRRPRKANRQREQARPNHVLVHGNSYFHVRGAENTAPSRQGPRPNSYPEPGPASIRAGPQRVRFSQRKGEQGGREAGRSESPSPRLPVQSPIWWTRTGSRRRRSSGGVQRSRGGS